MRNHCFTLALTAAIALGTQVSAEAVSLTGIGTNNLSDPKESVAGSGKAQEFQTDLSLSSITNANGHISFTSHFQLYNGYQVDPGGPVAALTHPRQAIYELAFTVEDTQNLGYTLEIDSLIRGYSTALHTSGNGTITATGLAFGGGIDTDTDDGVNTAASIVSDLSINSGNPVQASQTDPFANQFAENTSTYNGGSFFGTRSFLLRYSSVPTPTTNVFLQNSNTGEGSVRYGLENSLAELASTGQSQPGDAFSSNDLGHFVTVKVSGLGGNVATTPEPHMILGVAAALGLGVRHKQVRS